MWVIVVAVLALSGMHALLGLLNFFLGIAASVQADVWVAHTVAPIWSGIFFIITGCLGFVCAKKKTAYMILCFTAFSIVSLVTAVVSIQLLRLGLVNRTSDGKTYKKEKADQTIVGALVVTSIECLVCIVSAFVSCRMAKAAKKVMEQKRDGTFHIQANGQLDMENNNMCVVYTVGKGYHNVLLAADNSSAFNQESVQTQDEFTDLAALQDQCDTDWNFSQDCLNSSRNSLADSQSSVGTSRPFQSYLRPDMAYKSNKTNDAKTVTFSTEADQIVHLSPTRSVASSPSIHGSNEDPHDQRTEYKSHASRRLDKRLSAKSPSDNDSETEESMETKTDVNAGDDFQLAAHSQVDSTIPEVEILSKPETIEFATIQENEFEF